MPFPTIGQPMPRAADAYATADKWRGWILAAGGHGEEWARVLEWARVFHAGPQDSERIWAAIAAAVVHAPVSVVRDRATNGVVCRSRRHAHRQRPHRVGRDALALPR
jgi:hypothetical protein